MSISYSLPALHYSLVQDLDHRELKNLNYHVRHQDYFGTLATVLRLWYESSEVALKKRDFYQTLDELEHLQSNYHIKKK